MKKMEWSKWEHEGFPETKIYLKGDKIRYVISENNLYSIIRTKRENVINQYAVYCNIGILHSLGERVKDLVSAKKRAQKHFEQFIKGYFS